jgi:hypothetical protein
MMKDFWLKVIPASLQIESLTLESASRLSGLETTEIDVSHLLQLNSGSTKNKALTFI